MNCLSAHVKTFFGLVLMSLYKIISMISQNDILCIIYLDNFLKIVQYSIEIKNKCLSQK